jgi:hypothetical protein
MVLSRTVQLGVVVDECATIVSFFGCFGNQTKFLRTSWGQDKPTVVGRESLDQCGALYWKDTLSIQAHQLKWQQASDL